VLALLRQIPAAFWGVITGSLFTLFGVWLSNRAQSRRLELQFAHDRGSKREDRELTMKRDVYLPAIEAVTTGIAVIARLADVSLPPEKLLDDWARQSPALSRASLVAGDRTLELLSTFQADVSSRMFSLSAVRARLVLKAGAQRALMEDITRLNAENAQRVAQLRHASADASEATERELVMHDFEAARARVSELLRRHDTLNRELLDEQLRFSELCYHDVAELTVQTGPLLAAARAELGLPFDLESYTRMAQAVQKRTEADLARFVAEMRSITEQEMSAG
jgi:hypothetical protein